MKISGRCLVVLSLVVMTGLAGWAGTQNAIVMGSVYSSGAAVPGVTVRLINAGVGFSQTQTSSGDGTFTFSNVPPAENYVISVEKIGFSVMVLTDITVQVGEEKLVLPPFLLQTAPQAAPQPSAPPPSAASKPSPKAPPVALDLLSTTESGVIDTRLVHSLPLVNRDFIDLALLVPGTYPVEQGSVLQGASLVVNGARADMNNFLLDGADNNDYTINQSLPFQIVEAMQEFRVQASTSNAEYGRSGGAQINVVSRSGSNSLHGELFEFNRNSALAAGNFFSGFSGGTFNEYSRAVQSIGNGDPITDPTLAGLYGLRKPQVNQNQFGGNIGGPIWKDKLFGFFNWESYRLSNPRPLFEQVPGLPFHSSLDCQNLFGVPCDPTALAIYSLYPSPNVPGTAFTDPNSFFPTNPLGGFGAFSVSQAANRTNSDNFLERVDWRVTPRVSMSFKHNILQIDQVQAGDVPATANYPGSGNHVTGRNQNVSYNYVHQLTPRTTNEFRFGWNRFRLTATALDASLNPAALGLQNLNFSNHGLPTITVGGVFPTLAPFSSLGSNFATPSNRADNVFSFADNVTLVRGRHSWKVGGEFREIRLNVANESLGRGLLTFFSGPLVAGGDAALDIPAGEGDVASIARVCPHGLPSFSSVFAQPCSQFGNGFERNFSTRSFNGYVQDQWRPWPNFTVNYGIRYEVNTAPVELDDRLVNFYPSLATTVGVGGLVRGGSNTIFDPFGDVIGTAPSNAPRAGYDTRKNNFGPRFGFAWDPRKDGKMVVRGSYALLFDQQSLQPSVNMLLNPPFVQQSFSIFPFFALSDTFSVCGPDVVDTGCLATSGDPNSQSDWTLFPYSITAIDPHNKTPYIHQYHLGVEQEIGGKAVLEVAYVGSAGRHLPLLRDISQCTTNQFFSDPVACKSNPLLFSSVLDQENVGNSNFNSLQVRLETKNFHGLQLHAFYQWAKSTDDASSLQPQQFLVSPLIGSLFVSNSLINPDNFAGANNISPALSLEGDLPVITTRPRLPQDSRNLAAERSVSDFDIRHRFVVDYTYSVPRFAPIIGSGWQLDGVTTVQSGQPFTVYLDFFGTPLRPNVLKPVPINTNNPQGAIDNGILAGQPGSAFDFGPAVSLQPGTLGRNPFTGPKFVDFDFAVVKDTHLSERVNLQFRAEFFNLFNNVNFREPYSRAGVVFSDVTGHFSKAFPNTNNCFAVPGKPNGCSFIDPLFGQILQAFPARQIQLALKLVF
jgi:hypothetical protein